MLTANASWNLPMGPATRASIAELAPLDLHQSFQDFVASRPGEERWELIAGRFTMQAQPNFEHQIIAENLHRKLYDGLAHLDLPRVALQNPAIDLRPAFEGHIYVPDVAIIDLADIEPGRNVTAIFYLAAEILSPSDRRRMPGTGLSRMALKLAGYESLPICEAILLIEQRSFDVTLSLRQSEGWVRQRLTGPETRLMVPAAGLDCRLADLYTRTSLARKRG